MFLRLQALRQDSQRSLSTLIFYSVIHFVFDAYLASA